MPPKTRNANKKQVSGDPDTDTNESTSSHAIDPNLVLMQQMMEQMQEQMRLAEARAERREEQMRIDAQEDRERMKAFMSDVLKKNEGTMSTGSRSTPTEGVGMRSKKLDAPVLGPVESITMADFRTWRDSFEGYTNVLRLKTECDLMGRRTMLRSALDSSWSKLWTTQMLKILPDDDIEQILEHIRAYIRKQRNPVLDRRDFYRRRQGMQEKIDHFYADVKDIYESCEFGHEDLKCDHCGEPCGHGKMLREEFLRDKLLFGMSSEKHQEKVLEIPLQDLTLEKTHTLIQAMESSKSTTTELRSQNVNVDALEGKKGRWKPKSTYKKEKGRAMIPKDSCRNCAKQHEFGKCPAANRTCNHCQKSGHYEICCRAKKQERQVRNTDKQIRMATVDTVHINSLSNGMKTRPMLDIQTKVGSRDKTISWLCDSGAEVCVMSMEQLKCFGNVCKERTDVTLFGPSDEQLGEVGKVNAILRYKGKTCNTNVYLVKKLKCPILSYDSMKVLNILNRDWPNPDKKSVKALSLGKGGNRKVIQIPKEVVNNKLREDLFKEFPDVFPDDQTVMPLQPMKGPEMKIELVPEAKPFKRYKANTIPFYWELKVKQQLENMVQKDIIETVPIGEVGDWVLGMVVVAKQGSDEPRITVDFQPLNKYVKRMGYPTKTPAEEVAQIPAGMVWFTTLDGRHGYWQVPLAKDCRHLTTFITPWGHYRFKRNVMGLISAGDEHNLRGDRAIEGIPNVKKIVEDIVIYDKDYDAHVERVRQVIKRCSEYGITLSRKKAKIAQRSVQWCGYTLTQNGYTANPRLLEAIHGFPVPKSRTDVRSFNGLIQQFEALSPDLAEMMAPIRVLLSKKAAFVWTEVQQNAFDKVIKELMSPRVLTFFRRDAQIRLETDAAKKTGFGYALWQEDPDDKWRLLRCGSRTVTSAETRYSVTESELAAVVSAVKKLKLYLLGKHFTLIVDHQPLIPILNEKCLADIDSPRIVTLKEKLGMYNFTAVWREGLKHTVADVFSRHPVSSPDKDELEGGMEVEANIRHCTINAVNAGSHKPTDLALQKVQDETEKDPILVRLRQMIIEGFPQRKEQCPEISEYWGVRNDLVVNGGIVMLGKRLVIPKSLRTEMLNELHCAHQGIVRIKRRARQCMFWPGINNEITQRVQSCKECAENQASQGREPLVKDDTPTRPAEAIAADLFTCHGREYMVITDKYSGWAELFESGTNSFSTKKVKENFVRWFLALGVPTRLTSDNGPQFRSQEFKEFCEEWRILHDPSSPYHHIANGYAESAVHSMKSIVKKICPGKSSDNIKFWKAILEYRNTPRNDGLSPAQRLFGRPMRTRIPAHPVVYKKVVQDELRKADQQALKLKAKAEAHYNVGARQLKELKLGDVVRVQHHVTKRWDLIAEIVQVMPRRRSYLVRTETGKLYWRNRRFLRPYVVEKSEKSDNFQQMPKDKGPLRRSSRVRKPRQLYQA